jgi:uncharacterized RDD family membrane protein YckC
MVQGALAAQVEMAPSGVAPTEAGEKPDLTRAVQNSLFPGREAGNVIPFPKLLALHKQPPAAAAGPASKSRRRGPSATEGQGNLDFLLPAAARPLLDTTVEARICCEAPVAARLHRALAAGMDWSLVLIGYGLFLMAFRLAGGEFFFSRPNLPVFAGALGLMAFAYGALWAIAGGETAGMRWARLRLLTFDGFPPETRQRLARFAGACLSLCTGLGLLWCLADEERLTWADHISGTFPTPRALETQVFRQR